MSGAGRWVCAPSAFTLGAERLPAPGRGGENVFFGGLSSPWAPLWKGEAEALQLQLRAVILRGEKTPGMT